MISYNFSCRNCDERYVGCHSNCLKYKKDLNDYNEEMKPIREYRKQRANMLEYDFVIQRRIDRIHKKRQYS